MKDGFVKVAAASPVIRVADTEYNAERIIECINDADAQGVNVLVFPELCITGCSCRDLFTHDVLLAGARNALLRILEATVGTDMLVFVGLPIEVGSNLYSCAAAICSGYLLGLVPRENVNGTCFTSGGENTRTLELDGMFSSVFARDVIFEHAKLHGLRVAVELGDDLTAPVPPSVNHALHGATIIARMASFPETLYSTAETESCLTSDSRRLACGIVLAAPGRGESSTDFVYSGLCAVSENGVILAEAENSTNLTVTELDINALIHVRRARGGFESHGGYFYSSVWGTELHETELTRRYAKHPHLPVSERDLPAYCERQIEMQVAGLVKRMDYAKLDHCVVGISGGVDSTLAVMISAMAVRRLGLPSENAVAVTMPCFGTSSRTKSNAVIVAEQWGCEVRVIDIGKSVYQHFDDIGHAHDDYSIAFENSQARMRTMILMDIANKVNGLNVGTEDLSEYIDGWCTYNGDHTSMYDVNIGVTKTQVRAAVAHIASKTENAALKAALYDVLDCPVSPELLPIHDDIIEQKSEEAVGSYSLQDFFTYHVLINGFSPRKTIRLAKTAYGDEFTDEELVRWLRSWCTRLFTQQFKRSCLMDGPSVGTFSVSPRTGFQMPSDAEAALFLKDLDELEESMLLGDLREY